MPDIYQGSDHWNFSLVDPDNRQPVDYAARQTILAEEVERAGIGALLENWTDGRIKLRVTADLLELRRRDPYLFSRGSYEPLRASDPHAERLCAFMRRTGESMLVTAAALFPARGSTAEARGACSVPLAAGPQRWTELFSGRELASSDGSIAARDLFATLPVAVLTPSQDAG